MATPEKKIIFLNKVVEQETYEELKRLLLNDENIINDPKKRVEYFFVQHIPQMLNQFKSVTDDNSSVTDENSNIKLTEFAKIRFLIYNFLDEISKKYDKLFNGFTSKTIPKKLIETIKYKQYDILDNYGIMQKIIDHDQESPFKFTYTRESSNIRIDINIPENFLERNPDLFSIETQNKFKTHIKNAFEKNEQYKKAISSDKFEEDEISNLKHFFTNGESENTNGKSEKKSSGIRGMLSNMFKNKKTSNQLINQGGKRRKSSKKRSKKSSKKSSKKRSTKKRSTKKRSTKK